MKFLRLLLLLVSVVGFIGLSSCGKSNPPEPSVEEAQLKLLTKTWVLKEVRFGAGNTDRFADFDGMTLTVSGTFNSTAGTLYDYSRSTLTKISPWPKSGKWTFDANDPESLIIRSEDNIPMSYSVTPTQLQLTFNYTGTGYAGRVSAVEGSWTFLFTAQ